MLDLRQGCATGKTTEETLPSDALVLFGAMGDLAHKKIFPALYHMVRHGHLDVPVIGIARAARTDEHLKERVRDNIQQQGGEIDQEALAKLLNLLRYVGGDYEKPGTYDLTITNRFVRAVKKEQHDYPLRYYLASSKCFGFNHGLP